MLPPKVQVIVLQYNKSQDTVKCLDSLGNLDYPNFGVIVIDNASLPSEFERVRNYIFSLRDSKFIIRASTSNLGYSGGNNIGINYALENEADFILLLNNDATVEKDLVTKLIMVAESDKKVRIVGPAINEGNRTVCDGKVRWLKTELAHRSCHDSQFTIRDFYIPGVAMLIGREVIEKIGLLDERYFLYFEDADYCLRASRAGYHLKIVPEATVRHQVSSTASQLGSALLLRYHYRNALLFNTEHGPNWVVTLLPIWAFFIIIKQLIKITIAPGKRQISRAILNGVLDFYLGRFGKIS